VQAAVAIAVAALLTPRRAALPHVCPYPLHARGHRSTDTWERRPSHASAARRPWHASWRRGESSSAAAAPAAVAKAAAATAATAAVAAAAERLTAWTGPRTPATSPTSCLAVSAHAHTTGSLHMCMCFVYTVSVCRPWTCAREYFSDSARRASLHDSTVAQSRHAAHATPPQHAPRLRLRPRRCLSHP
jgi:hypothetical protein